MSDRHDQTTGARRFFLGAKDEKWPPPGVWVALAFMIGLMVGKFL